MIREDYLPIFERIDQLLKNSSLIITSQSAAGLNAEWQLNNGWVLAMECEPYSSDGITLTVMNPRIGPSQGYAIWILMKAASNLTGKDYGKPSTANQVRFLMDEMSSIIDTSQPFEPEYNRLNNDL